MRLNTLSPVSYTHLKHIIMKPIPDKRLGHVTAEYRSAAGLIKSAWKYEGLSLIHIFLFFVLTGLFTTYQPVLILLSAYRILRHTHR